LMVILQTFICKHLLGPDNLLRSVSESNWYIWFIDTKFIYRW
jgi:hypothetical protein